MSRPKRSDIALTIGLCGSLSAVALIIFGDTAALDETWINHFGLVFFAGIGAWLSGLLVGGMFGHSGWQGWIVAAIGAVLATQLGALIAGTFVLPVFGSLMAPIILTTEAIDHPSLLITWAVIMSGLHILVLKSVGERVSKG
ncbi:hypothetical protein GQR58_002053 [Nymphon striatum]|nr:hypothetical protein GQR58_002053 [Nymphon striatum]